MKRMIPQRRGRIVWRYSLSLVGGREFSNVDEVNEFVGHIYRI
jgi:hypothetical protein